ncbi:hypothetical protein L218DRAFT_375877 [Marasmius fiardii PR-910]|nr:hypothetical protein L218DRAFT_375877 [Marasmius fiardii PR-910]
MFADSSKTHPRTLFVPYFVGGHSPSVICRIFPFYIFWVDLRLLPEPEFPNDSEYNHDNAKKMQPVSSTAHPSIHCVYDHRFVSETARDTFTSAAASATTLDNRTFAVLYVKLYSFLFR